MDFRELWARAYNGVADNARVAASKAQERLVVVGGQSAGLTVKWFLVGILVAFLAGCLFATWWDYSGFQEFRRQAAELAERKQAENEKLARDLESLRTRLDRGENDRQSSDQTFVETIRRVTSGQCTVPVGPLNSIIAEAGK